MDFTEMVKRQRELDDRIIKEHNLEGSLVKKKILALIVEIGECCNEIQNFKFWKKNLQVDSDKIKEELIDILHFILSIGIESGFDMSKVNSPAVFERGGNLDDLFLNFYIDVLKFHIDYGENKEKDYENYKWMINTFLNLVKVLGLTEEDIKHEYKKKNDKNIERQDNNY